MSEDQLLMTEEEFLEKNPGAFLVEPMDYERYQELVRMMSLGLTAGDGGEDEDKAQ